jgi:hypothetical protein
MRTVWKNTICLLDFQTDENHSDLIKSRDLTGHSLQLVGPSSNTLLKTLTEYGEVKRV